MLLMCAWDLGFTVRYTSSKCEDTLLLRLFSELMLRVERNASSVNHSILKSKNYQS